MRKKFIFLSGLVLLSSVALAGTENRSEPEQLQILDAKIHFNLGEGIMEISFRYEDVAGHIDDAKKMVVIGVTPPSGGINFIFIPMKADESRGRKGDGITPDVITEGRAKYYAVIPDALELGGPDEIAIVEITVIDCRGRRGEAVFIRKYPEEKKKERKILI